MRYCSIKDCSGKHVGKGLCGKHWRRKKVHGTTSEDKLRHVHHKKGHLPEYSVWVGIRRRCFDVNRPAYKSYGGRGISVCDDWLGIHGFENFLLDMGRKPSSKHQIDRINNQGNYSASNCRWALPKVNSRNRRTNVYLTLGGQTMTIAEWSEKTGIKQGTISWRARNGWSVEKTLQP